MEPAREEHPHEATALGRRKRLLEHRLHVARQLDHSASMDLSAQVAGGALALDFELDAILYREEVESPAMINVLKRHVEALAHEVSDGLDLALERSEIRVETITQHARDAVLPPGRELVEDED